MRILVVEDEKRIADFLCRGLQGAGYAVDAAPEIAALRPADIENALDGLRPESRHAAQLCIDAVRALLAAQL